MIRRYTKEQLKSLTDDILDVLRKHNIPVYVGNDIASLEVLKSNFEITRRAPNGPEYQIPESAEIEIKIIGVPKME